MATAFNCSNPTEGWGLYSHFLGGLLLIIGANNGATDEEDEVSRDKQERVVADAWAKLLGNLYMIMRRMLLNGYPEDAAKMQQIVDLVVEQDLRLYEARARIHKLHEELDPSMRKFENALAQLGAGNIPEE